MPRYFRNRAILAKIEDTYGTDAAPTGVANAMQMTNVTLEPLAGQEVERELVTPWMGQQGVILTGNHAKLSGSVEIAGAGTAGDVPAYGPLLRACGLAEVITPGVDVTYTPVSTGFEAASLYVNYDGVNHVILGARGTVTIELRPLQIPRFMFSMTGLLGTVADSAMPAVDLSGFLTPVPVSKANTTFSLLGSPRVCEGISFDLANQVEPRFLIGHESVVIVDRKMTGSAVVEAEALATVDWFTQAQTHAMGALSAVHGVTAGNMVEFTAPRVQVGRPNYGETQKIVNSTIPLMFTTETGNDEFAITVR